MIVILAPQYSGGAKDSMGRFVNAVFNDLETSQFLVFDRIWMARKYSSAKYLRILPWFFAYWIFAYFELRKKNVKLIISISQEYVLPFSLKDQIVIVHDLIQLFFPRNLQAWIFYSKYLKFVLPRVREILTPSSTTLRYLSRFNYSKKGKVIGVPLDIGRRFSMDVDVVRDIDLLWIGTVASHKRLRYFLDSIKSCDFPINALIIVPPSNCADVENIIGNYVFPGSVGLLSGIGDAELAGIYKRSKYVITTSRLEGFCMPLIEGALAGCSLIYPNLAIYRELYAKSGSSYGKHDLPVVLDRIFGASVDIGCDFAKVKIPQFSFASVIKRHL